MARGTGNEAGRHAAFHFALTSANACLTQLEIGLHTGDHIRFVWAAAALYEQWALLDAMVASLKPSPTSFWEQRVVESCRYEDAHNALAASRYFARVALARAWAVLREVARQPAAPRFSEAPPAEPGGEREGD